MKNAVRQIIRLALSGFLPAMLALAQTATTNPATSCAAGTDAGYSYSGSATIGYNSPLGSGIAAGSAFGVKVGTCSKAIFEAAVWTGITGTAKQVGYSLFTGTFEYDLVKQGNFVFGGDGAVGGAQVTGAAGTALFQGGAHAGYDFGSLISKGKTSLFFIIHGDYSYLTNAPVMNAVRSNYWAEVRKTFK
jgi:hypothetical protein